MRRAWNWCRPAAWRTLLVLALCLAALPAPRAEVIDRVLAVVDGNLVTLSDLRTALALGLVKADDEESALEALVERQLMVTEASRYAPPEPASEAVDARLASLRDAVGASRFAAVLAAGGVDEADLRRTLRQDMLVEAYLAQRFSATAQPTEGEVDAYVAEHRAELTDAGGEPLGPEDATRIGRSRLLEDRRRHLVADWLAGLRRRADIDVRPVAPAS